MRLASMQKGDVGSVRNRWGDAGVYRMSEPEWSERYCMVVGQQQQQTGCILGTDKISQYMEDNGSQAFHYQRREKKKLELFD